MTFGATSTAAEVVEGVDLSDRTALVTGGGSGLGKETVRALASAGARVVIAARKLDQAERAHDEIVRDLPGSHVETLSLDLGSLGSVRASTKEFLERHDRLHILVNNAGVMATPFERTADGFELQFGTNHLGHFLLTNLLVPALLDAAPARVVNVASNGHFVAAPDLDDPNYEHREYEPWAAYGQSKSANILFTVELERLLGRRGVHVYAVHPGLITTELFRHLDKSDAERIFGRGEQMSGATSGAPATKTVEGGAATAVFAATSPAVDSQGGSYLADCAASEAAAWATDPDAARRLWEVSEQLVGEQFRW